MAEQPPSSAPRPSPTPLDVSLGSPKDLPLLYAHQLVVNFTGSEFYVTIYRVAPEPWTAGSTPNLKVEGVPLAHFAFATLAWLANVEACTDQIQKLHSEGHITDEQLAAVRKALGK